MNSTLDPWLITPRECVKFQDQFRSLNPQNGVVTGGQAKGFFLQSQLPALVLGQIWSLADTDSDGKMNFSEFIIACKLITLKLRGLEIPKALPQTLIASLAAVVVLPSSTELTPMEHLTGSLKQTPCNISETIVSAMDGNKVGNSKGSPTTLIESHSLYSQSMVDQKSESMIYPMMSPHTVASVSNLPPQKKKSPVEENIIGFIDPIGSESVDVNFACSNSNILHASSVEPALSQSVIPTRSMLISERSPSIESLGLAAGQSDWAIKGTSKLKYTQLFNTNDSSRTGFLTGQQARSLMVQTRLPQATLAQIWSLADMDSDGRLGCEEFVLAMYLCDCALSGEKIPVKLSSDLIPPSFRKTTSRNGSIINASRKGSISSQRIIAIEQENLTSVPMSSFEDKRKENFDKGQAELERRRKALLEIQRKEQEERERKEREDYEKREKARFEIEKKRQEELDREIFRQREIELDKDDRRKRDLEEKESARKETERQRQQEFENQRIIEMQLQRQREQEKVLKLKAQNQTLSIEVGILSDKIKGLSQKICDTRIGVTNVKTVIDGMRLTRDVQIKDMTDLKSKIKEQNQKLVTLSLEKNKLDVKSKCSQTSDITNEDQINAQFSSKQIFIKQLKDKIKHNKQQLESKQYDIDSNSGQLIDLKAELKNLITACEVIYAQFDAQRDLIVKLKNKQKHDLFTSVRQEPDAWTVEPSTDSNKDGLNNLELPESFAKYAKYRAIYEFEARNNDEITFHTGDIIMVPLIQNCEPGWLAGEINGHSGWFPEEYVEKVESEFFSNSELPHEDKQLNLAETENIPDQALLASSSELLSGVNVSCNSDVEYYLSVYPYESAESGDLTFSAGEMIMVTNKYGDWWTGTIGSQTGIFPSNYVQKIEAANCSTLSTTPAAILQSKEDAKNSVPDTLENNTQSSISPQNEFAEEEKIQEDADTEVSQINTQPKSDHIQESISRPMSTSSMTPSLRKKGEVAQVIAPYASTSNEQLSLVRGQLIMIRKKTDSGWWEGELQQKGRRRQIGWFPATYVKVLLGGRNSGRNTPVSSSKTELSETVLDKVIALYPYKAQNDDELNFDKDDIISVMGRDEPEWWRGQLNGLTGLFPSNYVGPLVSSGNI